MVVCIIVSTTLLKVTNILFAPELLQFWCFNGHMCVRITYEVDVESWLSILYKAAPKKTNAVKWQFTRAGNGCAISAP